VDDTVDGPTQPAETEIPPDAVLAQMLALLDAQGAHMLAELARHGHRQRGLRLAVLMTSTFVLPPALDEALAHLADLERTFDRVEDLGGAAVLVHRMRADVEIAVDALLSGRGSIVADEMRDAMEIEFLLRDFAARKNNLKLWATCDDETREKKFWPADVRRRVANDQWPGKGFHPPDKREYDVHSMGLHPTPGHPHSAKHLDPGADPTELLSDAGEILEHCRRLFQACHALLDAFGVDDTVRPRRWETLERMSAGHAMWVHWIEQAKAQIREIDPDALPMRGPMPRGKRRGDPPPADAL